MGLLQAASASPQHHQPACSAPEPGLGSVRCSEGWGGGQNLSVLFQGQSVPTRHIEPPEPRVWLWGDGLFAVCYWGKQMSLIRWSCESLFFVGHDRDRLEAAVSGRGGSGLSTGGMLGSVALSLMCGSTSSLLSAAEGSAQPSVCDAERTTCPQISALKIPDWESCCPSPPACSTRKCGFWHQDCQEKNRKYLNLNHSHPYQ